MLVCSVISCSDLSSIGYLVASDDAFICSVISYSEVKRVVFENWFKSLKKKTETGGKNSEKASFQVGMDLKNLHKQGGDAESPQKLIPATERCRPPLWLPTQALASLVHFVV